MWVKVASNVDMFQSYLGAYCPHRVTPHTTHHLHFPHIIGITHTILGRIMWQDMTHKYKQNVSVCAPEPQFGASLKVVLVELYHKLL